MGKESKTNGRFVEKARKLGLPGTNTAAAPEEPREYVQLEKQHEILSLFGTLDYDEDYDYRRERGKMRRNAP